MPEEIAMTGKLPRNSQVVNMCTSYAGVVDFKSQADQIDFKLS